MRALPLLCLGLVACVKHQPSPTEGLVNTIALELLSPAPGTPEAPNTDRRATFNLSALQEDGSPYPGDATIDVYISYGGVRTGLEASCGARSDAPIETMTVRGSVQNHELMLPVAYGTTSLWAVERGSHVVGASTPIYFPNPLIPNIQAPPNEMAPEATYCTNFEDKFVRVDHATGSGQLLIESVFGNAVSIVDTGATDYRSIYLYTFGRPSRYLVPGRVVNSFTGNVSKFIGFTEVNFPRVEAQVDHADPDKDVHPELLPPPIQITIADRAAMDPPGGRSPGGLKLLRANSSVVETTAKVCPIPTSNPTNDANVQKDIDSWLKYNTFNVATVQCDAFNSYSIQLPAKKVGNFDPLQLVGQEVTVRGMLKNSSGRNPVTDVQGRTFSCDEQHACQSGTCIDGTCMKGAFNFWTIVVRDGSDLPQ